MVIQRGEIWWAALGEPQGAGPGYRRPVVIVQTDAFNRSNIQTVMAAVITSNLRLAEAPGNFLLPRKESHLRMDSVVNVSQVVTLDKTYLVGKVGALGPGRMLLLEEGLRLVLGL
jgi:mRNA interferase MazF